jgi:UDP-glucose 4-epimerase
MRVLVTGGCGYIGTNFINKFKNKYDFYVVDTSEDDCLVPRLSKPVECLDVQDIKYFNPDCVVHLAATASIQACEVNKLCALNNNVYATTHLTNLLATIDNQPKLIFSSSCMAHQPTNTYGFTKNIAENTIHEYKKSIILRFFNVAGCDTYSEITRNKNCRVIPNLVTAALNGSVFFMNAFDPIRDYVHVSDVADCLDDVINNDFFFLDSVDVGTGIGTSITNLIDLVSKKTNRKILVQKINVDRTQCDTRLIADRYYLDMLNFKFKKTINDIIDSEIAAYTTLRSCRK